MEKNYVLELTLISAQGLKGRSGSNTSQQMKTYALAWTDSSFKLRTCIDHDGNENPTWNDQFLFKVSSDFLSHETSGISIEIFSVGFLRDTLLGTVRLLVRDFLRSGSAFNAVMIRRPSGRIQGILNLGIAVFEGADVPAFKGVSAISFRDLIGGKVQPMTPQKEKNSKSKLSIHENSFRGSADKPEDNDSTASRGWDGVIQEVTKSNHMKSSASCGKLYCEMETPSKADRLSPFIFNRAESFNEGKLVNVRSILALED